MRSQTSLSDAGRANEAPAAAVALTFESVSHSYGDGFAVEDVSFVVAAGEVVALLGESGCGKTTLLRVAAGIERPAKGVVRLGGRIVSGGATFVPPEKRGIGFMFQDYALFPHLSVLANVAFGLRTLARGDAVRLAHDSLRRVGLDRYAAAYPVKLSGGEQQRAALARAIAPRPGVLLMDEPFSGLDKRLRDSVRDETQAVLHETGATAVIVTHDPEEAMRMADRIVLMRRGRIVQQGAPENLYRAPATLFAARFFSDINEISAVVRAGRAVSPLGETLAAGRPDGPAILAIRPHGLRFTAPGSGVPGTIVDRRFLGETVHLRIAVAGLAEPLRASVRSGDDAPAGRDVCVMPDLSETLVFDAHET